MKKTVLLILMTVFLPGLSFAAEAKTAVVSKDSAASQVQLDKKTSTPLVIPSIGDQRGLPGDRTLPASAAPAPPAPSVDPAVQAYLNAPDTIPVTSGGTTADGGRKWTCPRGYRVINTAAQPFSESNLRCKKDGFFFDHHICGNCVYRENPSNPMAGCASGQDSC